MNALGAVERAALEAIDLEWQLDLLGRLIASRSDQGNESGAQRAMAAAMAEVGMEVDAWSIDLVSLQADAQYSAEIERREALGLVGGYGGGAGPTLALNGHVDVVGPGREADWSRPIWALTVEDGRAYGRGTVDMKGALSCALGAVRALRRAEIELAGTLTVQSVVGEEDGGLGTLATLRRGHHADAALVLEPTELQIAAAHCGALCCRVRVCGLAAHACMRDEGVSAIEKAASLLGVLRELERLRNSRLDHALMSLHANPLPISVGTIRGGEWPSSVPDEVTIEVRYGVAPGEALSAARDEFEATLQAAAATDEWLAEHPPEVTWFGGRFEPAETDPAHPLIPLLQSAACSATGGTPAICGVTFGADMRLLANVGGIPTVMFGPGDVRRAHAPDEFVSLDELAACTRSLVLTAIRYCGVSAATARPR